MKQADAMSAYIAECDRQLKVYGTRDSGSSTPQRSPLRSPMHQQQSRTPTQQQQQTADATSEREDANNNNTNNDQGGVLLCPRGLAAIPLLCAAAAESRSAYLQDYRLHTRRMAGGKSKKYYV